MIVHPVPSGKELISMIGKVDLKMAEKLNQSEPFVSVMNQFYEDQKQDYKRWVKLGSRGFLALV